MSARVEAATTAPPGWSCYAAWRVSSGGCCAEPRCSSDPAITIAFGGDRLAVNVVADILGALARWGSAVGADRAYLQVEADNHAALALYAGAGFRLNHRYRYRVAARGDAAGEAPPPDPS